MAIITIDLGAYRTRAQLAAGLNVPPAALDLVTLTSEPCRRGNGCPLTAALSNYGCCVLGRPRGITLRRRAALLRPAVQGSGGRSAGLSPWSRSGECAALAAGRGGDRAGVSAGMEIPRRVTRLQSAGHRGTLLRPAGRRGSPAIGPDEGRGAGPRGSSAGGGSTRRGRPGGHVRGGARVGRGEAPVQRRMIAGGGEE